MFVCYETMYGYACLILFPKSINPLINSFLGLKQVDTKIAVFARTLWCLNCLVGVGLYEVCIFGVCMKHEFCTFGRAPHSLPPRPPPVPAPTTVVVAVATAPAVPSVADAAPVNAPAAAADPAACDRPRSINLKRNFPLFCSLVFSN